MAFNGDIYAEQEVKRLCEQWGVKTIIETGTYIGDTTKYLATLAPSVYTIEINKTYYDQCAHLDKIPNINRILDNSPDAISRILPNAAKPILCFLDAHWGYHNPLLDELAAFANHKVKPIIVIHDFQVPNQPTWGYDPYDGGVPIGYNLVKPSLELIYGKDKYNHYYPKEVAGARRGILYVTPI